MATKECGLPTCTRKVIPGNKDELCHADSELLDRLKVLVPFVLDNMRIADEEFAAQAEEEEEEEVEIEQSELVSRFETSTGSPPLVVAKS